MISDNSAISFASEPEEEKARSINRFSTTPISPGAGVASENQITSSFLIRRVISWSDLFKINLNDLLSGLILKSYYFKTTQHLHLLHKIILWLM